MSLDLVTFQNKENLEAKPELPRINKVIGEDINELKDKLNSAIQAINSVTYNVETNGQAVLTGRQIDGKDVYLKRYKVNITSGGSSPTQAQGTADLGFTLSDVTIVELIGYIVSNTNNVFSLDTNNYTAGNMGAVNVSLQASNNTLLVRANNGNYNNYAVVDIYFTYND